MTKKVQPPQEAVVALLDAAHKQLAAETREEIARIERREKRSQFWRSN
jgi:hypothetical protein